MWIFNTLTTVHGTCMHAYWCILIPNLCFHFGTYFICSQSENIYRNGRSFNKLNQQFIAFWTFWEICWCSQSRTGFDNMNKYVHYNKIGLGNARKFQLIPVAIVVVNTKLICMSFISKSAQRKMKRQREGSASIVWMYKHLSKIHNPISIGRHMNSNMPSATQSHSILYEIQRL